MFLFCLIVTKIAAHNYGILFLLIYIYIYLYLLCSVLSAPHRPPNSPHQSTDAGIAVILAAAKFFRLVPVFRIRIPIRITSGFYQVPSGSRSGSGSRRAKMTHKIRKHASGQVFQVSSSVSHPDPDPDSIGSVDPNPDPGGQK